MRLWNWIQRGGGPPRTPAPPRPRLDYDIRLPSGTSLYTNITRFQLEQGVLILWRNEWIVEMFAPGNWCRVTPRR